MKVQRLNDARYDEILSLLGMVFSRKNGRKMDFEAELPKMCLKENANKYCHLGIMDGKRLVAYTGVYPFDVVVGDRKLRFATAGNVAVHPDFEGSGYMDAMLRAAVEETEALHADAVRLGGLRSRYNRYGFDACGQNYTFTFTEKNRLRKFPESGAYVTFEEIPADGEAALAFSASLYNGNGLAVPREGADRYAVMTTWRNIPYLARRDGENIGYLVADAAGTTLAEVYAVHTAALGDILCAWQKRVGAPVVFSLAPHRVEDIRLFSAVCESSSVSAPCHFRIRNFERVTEAFLRLKNTFCPLPPGELRLGIAGYGTVRITVDGGQCACRPTDAPPELTLDRLSATRYLFGPYPPVYTAPSPWPAGAWFPLPLSWDTLDRV